MDQVKEITDRINKSNIGLPHYEIERIVRETVKQIEEEERGELMKTVAMADPD